MTIIITACVTIFFTTIVMKNMKSNKTIEVTEGANSVIRLIYSDNIIELDGNVLSNNKLEINVESDYSHHVAIIIKCNYRTYQKIHFTKAESKENINIAVKEIIMIVENIRTNKTKKPDIT